MNQKLEFKSERPIEELKSETIAYFQEQGFKLTNNEASYLQFERGSLLRNMVIFNPLKWKSSTRIYFEKDKVLADFDINSIFQVVTLDEEKLWESFISNYQKTIETGKSLISENQTLLKETKKSSWKYIGHAVLGAVIFGIPSGIIAYITGIESIVYVGAVSGAMLFMMRKIKKEKNAT